MAPHDTAPFAALVNILEAPSTAPGSIRKACAAVEECITVNRDNLQAFFQACFPVLIKRVFGYDIEASWLNIVVKVGREADAAGLMALLSPQGRLFNAIMSADLDTLVHYTFPLERLPGHTQELLKTAAGRAELDRWPQYRGRITVDASGRPKTLTLRVFDYFMFWNAFYVLRGGRSLSDLDYPGGSTLMRADSQWGRSLYEMKRMGTNLITGLHGSHATALNTHPYFSLLEQYLNQFLPRSGGATSAGATSTFAAGYGGFSSSKTDLSLGATLLSILVEFWLTDIAEPLPTAATALPTSTTANPPGLGGGGGGGGDVSMTPASPLSTPGFRAASGAATPAGQGMGAVAGSPAVVPSSSPLRLMSYQPPSEEVLLGIKQLVRHVHVSITRSGGGSSGTSSMGGRSSSQRVVALPAQAPGLPPWLPETPIRTATPPTIPRPGGAAGAVAVGLIGPPACPAVQAISRKVYRFIRRALAQWPLGSSSSLVPLINLWLTILTPWGAAGGSGKQAASGQSTGGGQGTTPGRTGSINHLSAEISQRLHLPWPSMESSASGAQQTGAQYAPEWRGHVLAHLPFYTLLIPRFLELIYARLSLKGDAAAGEALLLLGALAAAGPDLIKLLKEAETALNRYRESHKKRVAGPLADLVPWIYDQAVDWEAAAEAGAPTNPPMMADVQCRLFGLDNSSAAYFGAAVLRAAHTQVRPDIREALGSAMTSVLPLKDMATTQPQEPPPLQGVQGTEQYMPAGHWTGLHYKGDWMKRPICSNEVAWLVRSTVAISDRLNHVLGLDQPWRGEQEEPPETVIAQGFSWLRQRGYRISLRPLAEIQVIGWLMVAALMWQFYRWCCAAAATV